jgi:hypothetical protein
MRGEHGNPSFGQTVPNRDQVWAESVDDVFDVAWEDSSCSGSHMADLTWRWAPERRVAGDGHEDTGDAGDVCTFFVVDGTDGACGVETSGRMDDSPALDLIVDDEIETEDWVDKGQRLQRFN